MSLDSIEKKNDLKNDKPWARKREKILTKFIINTKMMNAYTQTPIYYTSNIVNSKIIFIYYNSKMKRQFFNGYLSIFIGISSTPASNKTL